jgi:hypothetical protein
VILAMMTATNMLPRKCSMLIGQNLCLDRFHAHLKSHQLDACREEARSLLRMGFSRRAPGNATIAQSTELKKSRWVTMHSYLHCLINIVNKAINLRMSSRSHSEFGIQFFHEGRVII